MYNKYWVARSGMHQIPFSIGQLMTGPTYFMQVEYLAQSLGQGMQWEGQQWKAKQSYGKDSNGKLWKAKLWKAKHCKGKESLWKGKLWKAAKHIKKGKVNQAKGKPITTGESQTSGQATTSLSP